MDGRSSAAQTLSQRMYFPFVFSLYQGLPFLYAKSVQGSILSIYFLNRPPMVTYATCHIILQGFAEKRVILGIWDIDILPQKKPSPLPHAMIPFIFQLGTVHN